jgi:hypothetical protein
MQAPEIMTADPNRCPPRTSFVEAIGEMSRPTGQHAGASLE